MKSDKRKYLIDMIDSCFTYGGADRDSWNFTRYIEPYKKELGAEFDRIYEERLTDLKTNYKVLHGVSTDFEGCTYNSLIKTKK